MAKKGDYGHDYTTFGYGVTGQHEDEAKAAEEAKKPNPFGLWLLRKLGYKGSARRAQDPPHHGAPHHPHPHKDG
jgi:hypothetical protein